ncbi:MULTISPECIES: ATP-binding protein [unclassified Beijerinckia]|uniref:ATP-dependent nuclease n=1 Tax=unclassified Beijerinckia TaxID=2638183 RepID=UPI0008961F54|nr:MULTISPECIES: ATP-binding protein [unclassified Beijerinckia]MDH7794890.1 putative ATP-dependent endonuclease of OLD family [Beijerinckia sp. GAS462]SEB79417.1 Predicted ATP-dependent endonuclease of the OLD family, contains P-loop ATPase and TOPRIM domains [Beijerinckia sp. 28-YEA-48]
MPRIRKVEIANFRSVKEMSWQPSSGINCLIGPGDSGKSTILDAIDLCLGARRTIQLTDADFHNLDVDVPIVITLTIGDLDDTLKNIETYGLFLRGFDPSSGNVEDEPEKDLETVLTLTLTVMSDLEPAWTLVSDRAKTQNAIRNLAWNDRIRLAPTRIGVLTDFNLSWRRGSVLNRLTDEKADASAALAKAARDARSAFGDDAEKQLGETLRIVGEAATELGINVGDKVRALLDTHSATFGGGTISLHDEDGVPLRGLGVGSTRLLIAGLQRKAAAQAAILLVDELEHGLEPHRIIRFLGSLGAKDKTPPLQVFMTTHSPVALRELAGSQLIVVRKINEKHVAMNVGTDNDVQSTIRLYPDAFLAKSVLVCEGASEVGLVRGVDQYRAASGGASISAYGVALVDCGGGEADRPFKRASAFRQLGYRVGVLRDSDTHPSHGVESSFTDQEGTVFSWRNGRTLEDELFQSLPIAAIGKLLNFAIELHGDELINQHIKSATQNLKDLESIRAELADGTISADTLAALGRASRAKKAGWFKSISWMEEVARKIVAPEFPNTDPGLSDVVDRVFTWTQNA